jgi:HEAT repeat protein
MMARVIGGQVERLRTMGDDCPVDAGGRTVHWLPAVTSTESLRFLSTLAQPAAADRPVQDLRRRVAETAIRAIGYHADTAATAVLDRIASSDPDAALRRQAASTLGSLGGAPGVAILTRLIGAEQDAAARRSLVGALGQSREASAVAALQARVGDPDARVRAEAGYWFVVRGGALVIPEALKLIGSDADDSVRRRIVTALGQLPADAGLPALLQLVRTSTNPAVRKEALNVVSQSKDPRAIALLEEILKR